MAVGGWSVEHGEGAIAAGREGAKGALQRVVEPDEVIAILCHNDFH